MRLNKGFTLTETLITLGLIGVLAILTLIVLIKPSNETELIVGWKKAYSAVSSAYALALNENGGAPLTSSVCSADYYIRVTEMQKHLNVVKVCNGNSLGNCWAKSGVGPDSAVDAGGCGLPSLFYKSNQNDRYSFVTADGMYFMEWGGCGFLYVDTNGAKGPNEWGKDVHGLQLGDDKITNLGRCLNCDQNASLYLQK